MSDNSTVVPYVKNQGGTRSRPLCRLRVDVLQLCAALDVLLGVRDFPGRLNLMADGLSRTQLPPTEWSLHPQVFQRILRLFPGMQLESLRNSLQQPTTELLFSLYGSTSSGDGRPLPGLGRSGSRRLPSLSPHPKGPPTSGALPVSADSDCPPTLEPIVDLPSFARCVTVPRKLPLRQDLLLQFTRRLDTRIY